MTKPLRTHGDASWIMNKRAENADGRTCSGRAATHSHHAADVQAVRREARAVLAEAGR